MRSGMETVKDLIDEAKRRTILVALLVVIVAYVMSLTSSSIWVNLPVSIVVLAALRRLSFEVEFRWKPRSSEGRPQYPLQQNRRQLTSYDPLLSGLPCQVAVTRWRRIINSPVVEKEVDELTRAIVDEFVTDLWYSSITPDQEAPEELRILLNGVIAEVAQRARRVNLTTLLSTDVVELVMNQFELFRQMKAKIGPDIIASMSIDERDEKLKHAMMTSRKLHPALISPEAEYKVLKRLTGGVVALVLKRQDSHCRLLRTLARELLACAVLRPVLNFASPGYINELIENLATAKERQHSEKAEELAHQRIPDPIPQKKSSAPGVEMTSMDPLESRRVVSDINPLQRSNENDSKIIGDVGTPTRSHPSHDMKSIKEVKATELVVPDTTKELAAIPTSDWAQNFDALTQKRAQALAPDHLDNLWAKGRNYKKREIEKSVTLAGPTSITKDLASNLVSPKTVEVEKSPELISGQEGELTSGELSKESSTSTVPMKADDDHLDVSSLPTKDKRMISEQYESILFGDSKDGEGHLPGIGFSPLGTPRLNSRSPENPISNLQAGNSRGSELSRTNSSDNLGSSANSRSKTETGEQSPSRFRYHHKSGTSSQRLRRAVRLLDHRKSKSSGGVLDGWNLDVGSSSQGLTPMLSAREFSPVRSPGPASRWRTVRKHLISPVQVDVAELQAQTQSTMLYCQVIGFHFERLGSKPFAVYTIRVQDTEDRTWRIQRRFRNFEQLHRRLKDMPYYNLSLPPKRFLTSSIDSNFVRERCVLLDKYLKDLLAIPSVAELHEVWDFLSMNSQVELFSKDKKRYFWLKWFHVNSMAESSHYDQNRNRSSDYTVGNSVSMMKTLAVNVDDAVDDMFRQIRGVSDDISGALKSATTGIRHKLPSSSGELSDGDPATFTSRSLAPRLPAPMTASYLTDSEQSERLAGASVSEDEYGGNVHGLRSLGWQSDSDLHLYSSDTEVLKPMGQHFVSGKDFIQSRFLGSRLEEAFSDGQSPVESYASETVADDLGMPHEWSPPKMIVPLLNLVDSIFQLQDRGWIRRQVLWLAKQILQLGMGDAIDDWLVGRIQWLRREEVVASGIHWVKEVLWPDGIFVTKHPRNLPEASAAMLESTGLAVAGIDQERHPRPPLNSFEYRLEAARRVGLVRDIILEKAPTAAVNLIGRKQYTRCAKDIYYFSQSTVCVKQLTYSLLEMLLVNAFPELHDLIADVRSNVT